MTIAQVVTNSDDWEGRRGWEKGRGGRERNCWLRADRGTTLRVVGFLLAEMREQPGGSAKGEELIVVG